MQNVRKPHIGHVLPQAQSMREIGVRVQLHLKLRRPALASQAREYALKNAVATEKRSASAVVLPPIERCFHDGLRRSGEEDISFEAFSTSFAASCVASIASSRFSLYVSRSRPFIARS